MRKHQKAPNFKGIAGNRGMTVDSEETLTVALEYCGVEPRADKPMHPEFAEMVVEWAFSGDWVEA